ncbi:MAG: thioredoxin domain-containing protein [Terriglobales bacterium]
METSLTLQGFTLRRAFSFICGLGMMLFSALTIRHFFLANYPESIYQGSFCDINSFFNCNSSASSVIAAIKGVPLGYFGLFTGGLVALGAVLPSSDLERSNKFLALGNAIGVVGLLLFSLFHLHSLCLLCSGYYAFSILSCALFWKYGYRGDRSNFASWWRPSLRHLAVYAIILLAGAYGFRQYHMVRKQAQSGGVSARVVRQYFGLPVVKTPSMVSPYWTVRSTEKFEDAPIHVVEYGDFLCPDCLYLRDQLEKLKNEFRGKLNVAFQFFPLEASCNHVANKNKHPGACETAYLAAYDPDKFLAIHEDLFTHQEAAKKPEWRMELARRYGVEAALTDSATHERVDAIIATGGEYGKTTEKYESGIHATPTMIINNRIVTGTFPYEQIRAIFQALVDNQDQKSFIEHWED